MVDHSHWPETAGFMKRNWFWLSSMAVIGYYTVKWTFLQIAANILDKHPTFTDLSTCQKRVTDTFTQDLKEHERMAFQKIDNVENRQHEMFELIRKDYHEANQRLSHSVERVEDKVNMIVSKLLDK